MKILKKVDKALKNYQGRHGKLPTRLLVAPEEWQQIAACFTETITVVKEAAPVGTPVHQNAANLVYRGVPIEVLGDTPIQQHDAVFGYDE